MIIFRARQWGQAEWTQITVNTPGDDEDESEMEQNLASVIGSALGTSSLHVQRLQEDGEWEDLE